jgi:hypothetical protein
MACASLCAWDLCEIRLSIPFLAAPPRRYMGARSQDTVQVSYRCMRTLISLGLLGLRVSSCSWAAAGMAKVRTRGVIPSSIGLGADGAFKLLPSWWRRCGALVPLGRTIVLGSKSQLSRHVPYFLYLRSAL